MLRLLTQVSRSRVLRDEDRNGRDTFLGGDYVILRERLMPLRQDDFREQLSGLLDTYENRKSKNRILLHLVVGEYYLEHREYSESAKSLEQALSFKQEELSPVLEARIKKHLIHLMYAQQKWQGLEELYGHCDRIFAELDFIPEKICNLAEWALFTATCGDLDEAMRRIKAAACLNELTIGSGTGNDYRCQKIFLEFVRAMLEKKAGRYFEALEYAQRALGLVPDAGALGSGLPELRSELLILMIECSLELGMAEAASEQLEQLRDLAASFPALVKPAQIEILAAELALKFDNYPLSSEAWLTLIKSQLADGNVDFALNQFVRILNEYHRNYPLAVFEDLQKYHDSLLKLYGGKIPEKFRQSFLVHFEFKPRQLKLVSTHHMMLKLVELTRELLGEHDMDLLARKVLKMMLDFTRMERGLIFFVSGQDLLLKSTQRFSSEACRRPNTTEALCADLVKKVMPKMKTLSISDWTSDEQFLTHFSAADKQAQNWRKIDAKSLMLVPFVHDSKVLGIVYLDSSSRRPASSEDEILLLENFAGIVTVALNNARTIHKKDQDLQHVKKELSQQQSQLVEKYSIRNFLGVSPLTKRLLEVIEKISDSSATVLLSGESGVGKEMVAKTIHYSSPYRDKRFVGLNCAAIPDTLLESVLFGHRKGSFTDANEDKIGLFEEANGGTIFLDEIGEMPLNMQVKLLRVLEEGEVLPIGATEPVKISTRVVCATNRDLEQMVMQGTFRQDLFYRINVVSIHIPSLRERCQDIPLFVQHALNLYGQENGIEAKSISPEALEYLLHYDWPGNIRELINVIFNLSIFVEGNRIELEHLRERPELFQSGTRRIVVDSHDPILSLSEKIDAGELTLADAKHEFEKLQILRALRMTSGKVTSASSHLKMPRPQVSRLIKKYGIRKDIAQQDS